jgi:putative transposase
VREKGRRVDRLPRQPRRKSLSNVYHCMLRGVNKQDIFFEDKDYLEFQNIIQKTKKNYLYQLYSYVLMPNHIHLEIKDENKELSQIIHSIATSYAIYFNKKYKRKGHLFENRFLSKNVENTFYMLNLVRYIHQNPVKASICQMEQYKWSSYFDYFENIPTKEKEKITDTEEVFNMFLSSKEQSKEKFLEFNQQIFKFHKSADLLEYEMKSKLTDEEVIYFIKEELGIYNIQEIQRCDKDRRNEIIRKIKKIEGITQKQISRILGLNIKLVRRA